MRLVVSGYFGYGNAGDEAVLAGMLESLRAAAGDLEVTVLSGDPAHTLRTHGVPAVRRMNPRAVIAALRRSDGLVSGGGSLLQDRTSARPVAYYTGVMALARLARRPYVIYAQGLGPIERAVNRRLAAMALRGAAYVSLRDDASVALARALGVRRPIDVVPDPALALMPDAPGTGDHLLVAVRPWGPERAYVAELNAALRELAADARILALPMHEAVDRGVSTEVVAGIAGAEVTVAGADLAAQLAAIGSARLVIGMRLHALVLAAAAGVPAIAVSYDPKVEAFAARVGQAIVGHVGTPIDPAAIVAAARRAMTSDPAPYRARVAELRSQLQRAATESLGALRDGQV
jgi:polysaccharide pyruvyl transferase CsaB